MKSKNIGDIYLYLPILILGVYFIIRLIDQSQITSIFPLDLVNDWSSYLAQLNFLDKCGFLSHCPYWYNGFTSFLATSPGWYFFTYPLLLLFKDVGIASYISLILMYLISLGFIYLIGKEIKISKAKIITFFLFLFANAITIGNFIRLGRVVSIFSFMIFLIIFYFLLKYKNKKLDPKFYISFIILYAILLISHLQETVLVSIFSIGFFLIKNKKDKIKIIILAVISLILSSFWLIPFLKNIPSTLVSDVEGAWLLSFVSTNILTNIAAFLIPLILLIVFYLYWKTKRKSKTELLFFLPLIILNILFLLRITPFIPILRNVSQDPFLTLFIFFIIFFFFQINFNKFKKIKALAIIFILIIPIISVGINITNTPYFTEHSKVDQKILTLLEKAEDSYLMFEIPSSYPSAYYSYTPIYLNLSTAKGWYPYLTTEEHLTNIREARKSLIKKDCEGFRNYMSKAKSTNYITSSEYCEFSQECNFKKIYQIDNICLYKLNLSS